MLTLEVSIYNIACNPSLLFSDRLFFIHSQRVVRVVSRPRRSGTNKPDIKIDITLEMLSTNFHLPMSKAADNFGLGGTCFKRVCRRLGLVKWPRRKILSGGIVSVEAMEVCDAGMPTTLAGDDEPMHDSSAWMGFLVSDDANHSAKDCDFPTLAYLRPFFDPFHGDWFMNRVAGSA